MKYAIVIPSHHRVKKLEKCLNSIFLNSINLKDVKIYLYFNDIDESNYFRDQLRSFDNVSIRLVGLYRVPNFWNEFLLTMKEDVLVYLNDDCELLDDSLSIAIEEFNYNFNDNDGILGFNQINILDDNKCLAAFGMIGSKFADRFPHRQVWCIEYNRFYCDRELYLFAKEINKFYYCERAKLNHYHPCTDNSLKDRTHYDVRKWLSKDRSIFQLRQQKNYLWGRNFLLTKSK